MANPFLNALIAGEQAKFANQERSYINEQRLRQKRLAEILGGSYEPGISQEQINQTPEMIRAPGIQPTDPSFNFLRAAPQLAREGFAPELIALQQAQHKTKLEQQAAAIEQLLKGAQYRKTVADTIPPIELEREKSKLRNQEMMDMLRAMGIKIPGDPGTTPPINPTPDIPIPGGFTKIINGKTYVRIGNKPTDWVEWGAQ